MSAISGVGMGGVYHQQHQLRMQLAIAAAVRPCRRRRPPRWFSDGQARGNRLVRAPASALAHVTSARDLDPRKYWCGGCVCARTHSIGAVAVSVCARTRVRACVRACVNVCVIGGGGGEESGRGRGEGGEGGGRGERRRRGTYGASSEGAGAGAGTGG